MGDVHTPSRAIKSLFGLEQEVEEAGGFPADYDDEELEYPRPTPRTGRAGDMLRSSAASRSTAHRTGGAAQPSANRRSPIRRSTPCASAV